MFDLSVNKATGSSGRWVHVLWAYQGGSLPANGEAAQPSWL